MNRTGLIVGGAALVVLGTTFGWAASQLTGKDREEGRQLYGDACASCHGGDGKGHVSGLGVKVPLPDFTWCAFNSEETDRDWTLVVADGGPAVGRSEDMPSFRDSLAEEQIGQVVSYLRTFCPEDWPRGELNFPRPLITEKAWPEDEILFTWDHGRSLDKEHKTNFSLILEKRLGPLSQIELKLPVTVRDPKDGATLGGLGDVEAGIKYILYHNLEELFIFSGGAEVGVPSGSLRRGLGDGTTTLAPFLAAGKSWGDFVGQGSLKFEYPFVELRAPKSISYDLALSYPIFDKGRGTEAQLFLEINGKSEWGTEKPKHFQLYLTPSLRKGITLAGDWAVGFGVQLPVTGEREANYRLLGYLLYELPPFRFGQ